MILSRITRRGSARRALAQIGIERRCDQPHERLAFRCYDDAWPLEPDQFVVGQRLERRVGVGEIRGGASALRSTVKSHISRSMMRPRTRSTPLSAMPRAVAILGSDRGRVAANVGRVLNEILRQASDRGGAEPDQRIGIVGRAALEIAA